MKKKKKRDESGKEKYEERLGVVVVFFHDRDWIFKKKERNFLFDDNGMNTLEDYKRKKVRHAIAMVIVWMFVVDIRLNVSVEQV